MTTSPESSNAIGRYQLLEPLGVGPLGTTFRARDTLNDSIVAVKLLHPSLGRQESFVRKLNTAVRQAQKFSHPTFAAWLDSGLHQGRPYLVREYVDGTPLNKVQGKMPEKTVLTMAVLLATFIEAAHAHGFVHGRIRPSNIIVTPDKKLRLVDGGLPRPDEPPNGDPSTQSALLEETHFLSPEQIRSAEKVDGRTDAYSLGVLLWWALTGQHPFRGAVPGAILAAHLSSSAEPPRALNPEVSPAASEFVMSLLRSDPESRCWPPSHILANAKTVLSGRAPLAAPPPSRQPASTSPTAATVQQPAPVSGPHAGSIVLYAFSGILFALAALIFYQTISPVRPTRTTRPRPTPVASPAPTADLASEPTALASPQAVPTPDRLAQLPDKERRARQALEQAEQYSQQHPDDSAGIIQRFRTVTQNYPGTMAAAKAIVRAELLQQAAPGWFESAFSSLKQKAQEHIDLYQFGRALRLFINVPPRMRQGEFAFVLEQQANSIRELADNTYAWIKEDAEARLKENDFDGARRILQTALGFELDRITSDAEQQLLAIDEKEQQYLAEQQRLKEQQYDAFRKEIEPVLAARNFAAAIQRMQAALDDPEQQRIADWVQADLQDTIELAALHERIAQALPNLVGKNFPIAKFRGTVDAVDGETISIQLASGQGAVKVPLSSLHYNDVLAVLREVIDTTTPEAQSHLALLQMALQFYQAAESHIENCRKLGLPEERIAQLEQSLERLSASYQRVYLQRAAVLGLSPEEAERRADAIVRGLHRILVCVTCRGSGEKTYRTMTVIKSLKGNRPWRDANEFDREGGIQPGREYTIPCPRCHGLKFYYTTTAIDRDRIALQRLLEQYGGQLPTRLVEQCKRYILVAIVARAFANFRSFPYNDALKNPSAYADEYYYISGQYKGIGQDKERRPIMRINARVITRGQDRSDPFTILGGEATADTVTLEWTDPIAVRMPEEMPDWFQRHSMQLKYVAVVARIIGTTDLDNRTVPLLEAVFIDKPRLLIRVDHLQ